MRTLLALLLSCFSVMAAPPVGVVVTFTDGTTGTNYPKNVTNYPTVTTFDATKWFWLSSVPDKTNYNLPGNYVASTSDLNNASNVVRGLISTSAIGTNQIVGVISNTTAGPLTNHSDVLGAALTSGDVLGWNALTGKWTNGPPSGTGGGGTSTYDLSQFQTNGAGAISINSTASITNLTSRLHFYVQQPNGKELSITENVDGTTTVTGDGSIQFQQTAIFDSASGNGSGLTNLNADYLASGTVPDARLSGNVALYSGTVTGAVNAITATNRPDGTALNTLLSASATNSILTNIITTGGGISLINSSNSPVPIFKSLTNGANITITDQGTNISIATTSGGDAVKGAANIWTGVNQFSNDTHMASLTVSNTLTATELDVGTLVLTNAPTLDLSASTNYHGTVVGTNVYYATNSFPIPVNLTVAEGMFQTNASFSFTSFVGLSTSNYQHALVHVYAPSAVMTFPANCHVIGYTTVTNQTDVLFNYDPKFPSTNALCVPIY